MPTKTGGDLAVVKKLKPNGAAASVPDICPGLVLLSVDGKKTAGLKYNEQVQMIREAGRPMTLVFRSSPSVIKALEQIEVKAAVAAKSAAPEPQKTSPKPAPKAAPKAKAKQKPRGLRRLSVALGVGKNENKMDEMAAAAEEADSDKDAQGSTGVKPKRTVSAVSTAAAVERHKTSAKERAKKDEQMSRQREEAKKVVEGITRVLFTEEGSLGIKFAKNVRTGGVEVSKVHDGSLASKHPIVQGMVLKSVAGKPVKKKKMEKVVLEIKEACRPLQMTFAAAEAGATVSTDPVDLDSKSAAELKVSKPHQKQDSARDSLCSLACLPRRPNLGTWIYSRRTGNHPSPSSTSTLRSIPALSASVASARAALPAPDPRPAAL